ncbi:MAG: hypothetical protein HOJ25_01745 [Candidatus Magasanikbacteria bacterium]|nr:hypothetical protein [Candidatus Magasanikbacteria bacterium]MBT5820696.1 hypothetical protein [Candidatus Magasanikbacteria bacterium]MBT6294391.1 hypothetical protein [Candidatus Magasanikbacteria bacterium]
MSKAISPRTFYCIYAISLVVMLCASFLYSIAPASALLLDPRCHTLQECKDARLNTNTVIQRDNVDDFFYTGSDAEKTCGEGMGFCAAASAAATKISFSGKQKFLHIGDFIQFAYKYGMVVASILAVLMIIVSGIQWTVSGGNTSTIGAAKKRIAGAITGLMLLALAYTILNIINPAMVNLRLPQVWIVKKAEIPSTYCQDIAQPNDGFTPYKSIAKKPPDQIKKIVEDEKAMEKFMSKSSTKPIIKKGEDTVCGQTYIANQKNACMGLKCATPGEACNPATLECEKFYIAAKVVPSGSIFANDPKDIVTQIDLVEQCNNGESKTVKRGTGDLENGTELIKFTEKFTPDDYCNKKEGVLGYYFLAIISDGGVLGDVASQDDYMAIGVGGPNKTMSVNPSKRLYEKFKVHYDSFINTTIHGGVVSSYSEKFYEPCKNDTENLFCGCQAIPHAGDPSHLKNRVMRTGKISFWGQAKKELKPYLITEEEMKDALSGKKPIVTDFKFNRKEFPYISESQPNFSCVN